MDTIEIKSEASPEVSPGGFAPLRVPLFRDRWIASTVSSLGTWMQDTAGTWLMATLTASPLLIALMQTAASLPVLCLGLLAGATADIFDRRKLQQVRKLGQGTFGVGACACVPCACSVRVRGALSACVPCHALSARVVPRSVRARLRAATPDTRTADRVRHSM